MSVDTSDFEVSGGTPEEVNAARTPAPPPVAKTDAPVAPVEPPHEAPESEPEGDRDDQGRFRGRHRARSQQAGPQDVPRIAALTKKLRETEASYETRIKALEERLNKPAQTPAPPQAPQRPQPQTAQFTERMPRIEDFANEEDPYLELAVAKAEWKVRKNGFEAHQKRQAEQSQQQSQQHNQHFEQWVRERQAEHDQRLAEFVKATPDAKEHWAKVADMPVTPVILAAIELHEQGPQFMLALAKEPGLLDELYMLTDGKDLGDPVKNPLVASVQRRLSARVQAAQTGSAAPPPKMIVAPRPPNPVRTAPQAPADSLPGDDDSLEAHEKVWGSRGRRRR